MGYEPRAAETQALPAKSGGRSQSIRLRRVDEVRGSLCAVEAGRDIPFQIRRVYWIFGVPGGGDRANHAHRSQHELLVAARGSFMVHCDDGSTRSSHLLDSPNAGLLLPPERDVGAQ